MTDENIIVASLMLMLGKNEVDISEDMIRSINYDIIVHKKYTDEDHISFTLEARKE